jgi:phosphoenolpyruvate-protein kinase (PTS system EI component)
MAGDPDYVRALLESGLRVLSVAPASLGRTKAAISRHTLGPA